LFDFKVKPDAGEPYDVTATTRDIVTWERGGKDRSFSQFGETMRMGDMYGLAHAASKRQGLFSGDLATFEATVDLELVAEGDADPTKPGA